VGVLVTTRGVLPPAPTLWLVTSGMNSRWFKAAAARLTSTSSAIEARTIDRFIVTPAETTILG
jgi:hypothetical protein